MVIPIFIDTASIVEQFEGIGKEQVDDMCDNIAKTLALAYRFKLVNEAESALHQTKRRYINAIKVLDTGKMEGTVLLDYTDKMVKMIEEGCSPFDMKIKMLQSAKVKIGKNGNKYITIPMRMGTPDAAGESDVFSSIMPDSVYQVVKDKATNIVKAGGGLRSVGLTVNELTKKDRASNIRKAILDSEGKTLFEQYVSMSSIYVGLIKNKDGVTGQSKYNTFRRISERSDKLAFIHPGIERHDLINKALTSFDSQRVLEVQLKNELSKLGIN